MLLSVTGQNANSCQRWGGPVLVKRSPRTVVSVISDRRDPKQSQQKTLRVGPSRTGLREGGDEGWETKLQAAEGFLFFIKTDHKITKN